MSLLPVIKRELGASARQAFTYTLRWLGALALLVTLWVYGMRESFNPGVGGVLFAYFHRALFLLIWCLVPLLTADCISRERREGTLPLLFLTPLRSGDIVHAKTMVHSLRAFSLWLAVLPVSTLSFLIGGVGWREVGVSVSLNFSSLLLATGAGLVSSVVCRSWTRALAVAGLLAFGLMLSLFAFVGLELASLRLTPFWNANYGFPDVMGVGFATSLNLRDLWQNLLTWPKAAKLVVPSCAILILFALVLFVLLVRFAAWRLRKTWREEPPSARVLWLRKKFFTPVFFRSVLGRWLRWELERNPIGWLERRSWSGRLVVWSWLAVVVCVYSWMVADLRFYQRGFHEMQTVMATLLVGSIALSSTGSFRRERETGVLELLMVAPLRISQIIFGRVRGLWSQFLPSAVLLFGVWIYLGTFFGSSREGFDILRYLVTFATLPVVGLYFSLARTNFIAALFWTLVAEMGVPKVVSEGLGFCIQYFGFSEEVYFLEQLLVSAAWQVMLAGLLAWRLHRNLENRKFALKVQG